MIRSIIILSLLFTFALTSCMKEVEIRDDFERYFKENGYEGSFMLYDKNNRQTIYYNKERCSKRFSPGNTFNVFQTMAAVDTRIIRDESTFIPWDSTEFEISSWNKDHTLESAFKGSVDWYFQETSKRIGKHRLNNFIRTDNYGNSNIEGRIDSFWVDGTLKISQEEQIRFLRRINQNKLHFSERAQELVKRVMITENTPEYTFRSKTGTSKKYGIGWHIGYIEIDDNTFFFTTNIFGNPNHKRFHFARIHITQQILKDLDIL